jgi:hypothetical protein
MRYWASFALSLALATPAQAAPVDEFADATSVVGRSFRAAAPRMDAAAGQRQQAAQSCLDVLRATPEPNRETLLVAYALDVVVGRFTVARPLFGRYQSRLERIRLRREPALTAARRILRGQLALVDTLVLSLDDTCTIARQWQQAGWRTPPRSIRLQRRLLRIADSYSQETDEAERRLRRAGHPRAARILERGIDVGGESTPETDPVVCAVVGACP